MPVSSHPVASEHIDIYSIYPSYYFPLYANTPSSLFQPILISKLYAESDGRWSSDQVKNYVSAFNNATGTDLDADDMFDFESEFDIDDEENTDSRGGQKADNSYLSKNPGRKKVIESLLSSGSYMVYNSLTGSSDLIMPEIPAIGSGGYTLLSRAYISPHKKSNGSAAADGNQQNWISKFDQPESEPKIDKIL
jgi:hypothetical protein